VREVDLEATSVDGAQAHQQLLDEKERQKVPLVDICISLDKLLLRMTDSR